MMLIKNRATINASNSFLDIDNPRLQSKLIVEKSDYKIKEQQYILIFLLLSYDKVDQLLLDMIQNIIVSQELLENDVILAQQIEGKYIIKEGNRRVCALKILFEPEILNDVLEFVNKNSVFRESLEYDMFVKAMKKILKSLEMFNYHENKEVLSCLFDIKCKVYGCDSDSSSILELMLRRLHIYQKRDWKPADQQLFEYNIIMHELQCGAESINEAIDKALSADTEGVVNNSEQKSSMKKKFNYSNFYQYLLLRLETITNDKEVVMKFKKGPLPICETLVTRLSTDYHLKLYYNIDTYDASLNKFVYELIQEENGVKIKNPQKFVDDLVMEILNSREKPIAHTEFKTKTAFDNVFSEIVEKHTISLNDGNKIIYYEIWKNEKNKEIEKVLIENSIIEISYNGHICNNYDCSLPGEWTIKTNSKLYIITVKEFKNPTITQKKEFVTANKLYYLDDLFLFKNSFDEDKNLCPLHPPIIQPVEQIDYNNKSRKIIFRNPGSFTMQFEMEDKITKLRCTRSFIIIADDKRPIITLPKGMDSLNYIKSYFNKTNLNVKDDVSTFIVELNKVLTNNELKMIYVASFRSLVELVVNDINDIIKLKFDKSDLGPKYNEIMEYALKHENFLDIVKKTYRPEHYDILKSFITQVSTSVGKDGFISFLNLSSHSTGRFTDKKMVVERKIFIEFLINFLDFLNDREVGKISS